MPTRASRDPDGPAGGPEPPAGGLPEGKGGQGAGQVYLPAARNTRDCLTILRELFRLGVTVQFEKENIDTGTLTSELMVSVSASLAQQESVSISQNQRLSYQRRMERGEFITCKAPFGYRMPDGKNLEIYEDEARLVRQIFDSYLQGKSTLDIAG